MNRDKPRITSALGLTMTLCLALCFFCKDSLAARLLTLHDAITMAVDNDPETKNAKRSVHIGQTRRSQARLRYLPRLDFGLINSPQVDYFGQPIVDKLLWNSYVGLDQPLYAGGTIKNSVKLAESEIRRQELEHTLFSQRISSEATKSYFQTLSAQGTVEQYEALLQQGEEDLREAQTRLAAGTSSKMEVLEVSTRLLEVQQKLSQVRAEHQEALSGLKKVLGLEGDEYFRLIDEMPIPDIKADFDTLLNEAHGKRPELKYFAEDATYKQLRTDIEKGKQKPQLSLVAMHEWQSPQVFENNKNFLVMLKASYSWENSTLSFQENRSSDLSQSLCLPPISRVAATTNLLFSRTDDEIFPV